jgi:hypothetical protein
LKNIKDFKTCELVEELKQREEVEKYFAEPYDTLKVITDGPAVVLVIIDWRSKEGRKNET